MTARDILLGRRCAPCGKLIRGESIAFGQDEDHLVYFDAGHERCFVEWHLALDESILVHAHPEAEDAA